MRYSEDAPACGCGCTETQADREYSCDDWDDGEDLDVHDDVDESMDGDHQTALESVYGSEDSYLDASWEDQYDLGE